MRRISKATTDRLRSLFDADLLLSDLVFVVFATMAGAAIDRGHGWVAALWIAIAIVHLGHTFKR